jgi:hypothetical protein
MRGHTQHAAPAEKNNKLAVAKTALLLAQEAMPKPAEAQQNEILATAQAAYSRGSPFSLKESSNSSIRGT